MKASSQAYFTSTFHWLRTLSLTRALSVNTPLVEISLCRDR